MHTDTTDIKNELLTITPDARDQFINIMQDNGNQYKYLRLGINATGCCGHTYIMMFENNKKESDHQLDLEGLSVLISRDSLDMVQGAQIDFQQSDKGQGFVIENPNKGECSCGGH